VHLVHWYLLLLLLLQVLMFARSCGWDSVLVLMEVVVVAYPSWAAAPPEMLP
jgi:hypothetical protein